MKFSNYIAIREAEEAQQIDAIFNQASSDIQKLFSQLYQGTADMVRGYEKASLPDELQRQILQDLSRIAQKVKGASNNMTDPRGTAGQTIIPKSENVTVDTFIKNISENIQYALHEADPSIIQDMGSHGVGPGGKKAYDFKSVITNTYRLVMDRMSQLKDAVFKHVGLLGDIHGGIGDLGKGIQGLKKSNDTTQALVGRNPAKAGPELDKNAWTLAAILHNVPGAKLLDHPEAEKFVRGKDVGKIYERLRNLSQMHGRVTLQVGANKIPLLMDDLNTTQSLQSLLDKPNSGFQRAKDFLSQHPGHDAWGASATSDETMQQRQKEIERKKAAGDRLRAANATRRKPGV